MSFLNLALLGGVAALVIPILIHLFHKNRFREVPWGAMHLLETVIRTNRRKLRVEQWLLLALRAAIPAILALAMARPVWRGAQALLGETRSSTILLLDNSYSMQAGKAGLANFSLAQDEASEIISHLRRGSETQVVLMGAGGAPLLEQPTTDLERATLALEHLSATYGPATVPAALQFAGGLLASSRESVRQVVVLTDFQRVSFENTERRELIEAIARLKKTPVPPSITFFEVGADLRENMAVEALDYTKLSLGVGQRTQVRGNLHNYGDQAYSDVRVYFKVDGKEKAASQVNLGPRQTAQVLFSHAFDSAGSHVVEIYADADPLKADNSAQASITVRDQLPVLLVDGSPSPEPLKSEVAFAEIALRPFGEAKSQLTDLITTQTVRVEGLNAQRLAAASTVILANVRKLEDPQVRALEDYVRNGGGLLIFPGDKTDIGWYERALFKEGKGVLPLPFSTLKGGSPGNAPGVPVVAQRYENPALEIFNDPRNGSLAEAGVKLWLGMKEDAASGAQILARLETGDPFLVEKSFGEGKVILCCTAADADWSSLPLRSSYLPLLQRLSVYLASTVFPPRNLECGQPLVAFRPAAEAESKARLALPDGAVVEMPVLKRGPRAVIEYGATQAPGLYTLTPGDGLPLHYVVNASRQESELGRLSAPEITEFAQQAGVELVRSKTEYAQAEHARRYGREIWKGMLWALLALCLGELVLQQKITGVRRA